MTQNNAPSAQALLEHAGWMRSLASRLVGSEAEDLVQDSWVAALEKPPREDTPLGAWLGSVVRNKASNAKRSGARRAAHEADAAAVERTVPTPEELVERSEAHRGVVDAVLRLPEPMRATLLLRYFEGLSALQIAERTGTNEATVRSRVHRGIARLREQLDRDYDGDRQRWVMALTPLVGVEKATVALPVAATLLPLFAMSLKAFALALPVLALFGWLKFSGGDPARFAEPGEGRSQDVALQSGDLIPIAAEADRSGDRSQEQPTTVASATEPALAKPAAAALSAPRVINVVDEVTGEPAWDFALEALPPFERSKPGPDGTGLITDAEYEWWTDRAKGTVLQTNRLGQVIVPAGMGHLRTIDRWRDAERLRPIKGGSSMKGKPMPIPAEGDELLVDFGRHVFLDVERPPGVELSDLVARLQVAPPAMGIKRGTAPVRTFENRAFARFRRIATEELQGVDLHVMTMDGTLSGTVEAAPYVGTGAIAPITLEGCAAMSVLVTDAAGSRVKGLSLDVYSLGSRQEGEAERTRRRLHWEHASYVGDEQLIGRFDYRGLVPGDYELRVSMPHRASVTQIVTLEPASKKELEITLEGDSEPEPRGLIDVRFTSATGTFHRPIRVQAWHSDGPFAGRESDTGEVTWTEVDGAWSGRLLLENAAAGSHAISLQDVQREDDEPSAELMIDRTSFSVQTGKVAEIFIQDDMEFTQRTVRAIDDATGEPIPRFDVNVIVVAPSQTEGEFSASSDGVDGTASLYNLRSLDHLQGVVLADDYIPFDLTKGCLANGDIEVRLKRGWAGYFTALDQEHQVAAGLTVTIDGVNIGTTGTEGWLLATADRCPDKVEFSAPGWTIVSAPFLDKTGQIVAGRRDSGGAYFVSLRRK